MYDIIISIINIYLKYNKMWTKYDINYYKICFNLSNQNIIKCEQNIILIIIKCVLI